MALISCTDTRMRVLATLARASKIAAILLVEETDFTLFSLCLTASCLSILGSVSLFLTVLMVADRRGHLVLTLVANVADHSFRDIVGTIR